MTLEIRKVAEDATTITLGWDPVAGSAGYKFTREKGLPKASHTWDDARAQARFAKDSAWYKVEVLLPGEVGTYPPVQQPPPDPPSDLPARA